MFPEIGSFGPFTLYSFGLMAALALVVPAFFLALDLRQRGMNPGLAVELAFGAGIGGFVGARLYYVVENRGEPGVSLISGSGLTWYGGLIGGVIGVWLVTLWRRKPIGVVANLAAAPLALGYAIGRMGCQLSGDGDYGSASSLPWAMSYPDGTVPTTQLVHPTPLYEAVAMLAIFWLLWRTRGRLTAPWSLFGAYLVLSGAERFLVEFIRQNPEELAGLTTAQLISVVSVAIGAALLLRGRNAEPRPVAASS
ncbi:MAG: prolipoprotein diacylglyceryl transferase [Thermoleophilia bacterium]|nr:prolipoprotein diacylglyceryl transferase [Thermoleophilia bacterium]